MSKDMKLIKSKQNCFCLPNLKMAIWALEFNSLLANIRLDPRGDVILAINGNSFVNDVISC